MNDAKKYYENTKDAKPHSNVIEFIETVDYKGNALDLGCGAGRDTIFLIKNGWKVTAVDIENTENIIEEALNEEERANLKFVNKKFGSLDFEKYDLVVAMDSLPFCGKNTLLKIWNSIVNSINSNGYFVGSFFGVNDSWNIEGDKRAYLTEIEVKEMFKDFEIVRFEEIEKDGKTALNNKKHWHVFRITAKKN